MGKIGDLKGRDWSVELIDYSEPDNRPKAYYYRPTGMQVGPWPCDLKSQKHYLERGFLLEPPIAQERKPQSRRKRLECPICGKHFNRLSGLIACLKKHKKEEVNGIS